MIKEIFNKSLAKYKSHWINSWVISIICGLFIGSLFLLGLISEFFIILFIPLVILPFLFSCILAHASLMAKDYLSAGSLFKGYSLFFRYPFFSSFGVLRSLLKAIIANILFGIVVTIICYSVYSQSPTFNQSMNELATLIARNEISVESMEAILTANDNELYNFVNLSNGISTLLAALVFIFSICFESITIYSRLGLKNTPLAHQIARASLKLNYKKYLKVFLLLNWPLFALIAFGMVIGCLVSIYGLHNYTACVYVGTAFGIGLSTLYLPFYFSNMESIFEYLSIDIASLSEEYVKDVFKKYGVDIEINKEVVDANPKETKNPPDEGNDN